MKYIKFLLLGIFFGIVLVKSEAVSWYRIYEVPVIPYVRYYRIRSGGWDYRRLVDQEI